MKNWFIAGIVVLLLTVIGGTVMASGNSEWNFDDHLPFMQERHADLTDAELEERFNECISRHEEGDFGPGHGMMRGGMMGQGHGHGNGSGHGMGFGNRGGFPPGIDEN